MKGLYFYKLSSPYQEDITKDCKLTINDIDHNFITLKNTDIKDIVFNEEDGTLTLTQIDGEQFIAKIDLSHFTKDFSVRWDEEDASLVFNYNGEEKRINEFISHLVDNSITNIVQEVIEQTVTDNTLIGVGVGENPLGINPVEMAGTYKSVECVINKINGEYLPNQENLEKGMRFLTYEKRQVYGNLYSYDSVKKINEDLKGGWRVPSKSDWDAMLNGIEICDADRTHSSKICNKIEGKYAGKLLKSNKYWKINTNTETIIPCDDGCYTCNGDEPQYNPVLTNGVDTYGMTILPSGYGDGGGLIGYIGERTEFWTFTETERTDVYTKRFAYNTSGVEQIAQSPNALCSLRLVKDYNGTNFMGVETINGVTYQTILMPSIDAPNHYAIWLASNVAFDSERYNPVKLNESDIIYDENIYYINEWNGFQWLKKELADGDSLVIKVGPDGDNNREYQLIDGELINIKRDVRLEMIDILENTSVDNIGENGKYISNVSQDHAKISASTKQLVKEDDNILSYSEDGIYSSINVKVGKGNREEGIKRTYHVLDKNNQLIGDTINIDETLTNESYISTDIPVAGGPLADLVSSKIDTIKAGTSVQELLMTLFCQEKYPSNPHFVNGSINVTIDAPSFTSTFNNNQEVEAGSLLNIGAITAKRASYVVSPSKWEGFDFGYAVEENTKMGDGNPSNPQSSTPIQETKYTLSREFNGFAENYQTQTINNSAYTETKVAALNNLKINDGTNTITASVTGASYSVTFTPSPSEYYACSNLGNTQESLKISGETHTVYSNIPTNSYIIKIKGVRYAFMGISKEQNLFELNSQNIRELSTKVTKTNTLTLSEDKDAWHVIIAFPESWGTLQSVIDAGNMMTEITKNFSLNKVQVEGNNNYKPIQYNVYVYSPTKQLGKNVNYNITIG